MALSQHQPGSSTSSTPTLHFPLHVPAPNFPSDASISAPNPVPTTRLFSAHFQSTSESSSDSDSPSKSPSEDPSKNSSDSSSNHSENHSENSDEDSAVCSSEDPSSEPPSDHSKNHSKNSDEYSGVHSETPSENSPKNSSDDQDTRNIYQESPSATIAAINQIADLLGPDGRLKPEEQQHRIDNGLCLRCVVLEGPVSRPVQDRKKTAPRPVFSKDCSLGLSNFQTKDRRKTGLFCPSITPSNVAQEHVNWLKTD